MDSFWFVAFGILVGGILGALVGGASGMDFLFWVGMAAGGVAGGAGGAGGVRVAGADGERRRLGSRRRADAAR